MTTQCDHPGCDGQVVVGFNDVHACEKHIDWAVEQAVKPVQDAVRGLREEEE